MSALRNIANAADLENSGLQPGDPVHLGVIGPGDYTNDARFEGRALLGNEVIGVILSVRGKEGVYPWEDITELWPLPHLLALSGPAREGMLAKLTFKISGK